MTIAKQLKIKDFPFEIKDSKGNLIYCETSNGYWYKREYDSNGNVIYSEKSNGYWYKREYDSNGNEIYFEDSDGYWAKNEYDSKGNLIYYENSIGYWSKKEYDSNSKEIYCETSTGKIMDGSGGVLYRGSGRSKTELTLDEIAQKFGIPVSQLKIKK